MKTKLPAAIKTVKEAKVFLWDLHSNGEAYHPEDNAKDCLENITDEEGEQLNRLMNEIYLLEGNEHYQSMVFDPCQFLLDIDVMFRYKDLSGRGFKGKRSLAELKEWDEVKEDDELREWMESAEEGDEYSLNNMKFERI